MRERLRLAAKQVLASDLIERVAEGICPECGYRKDGPRCREILHTGFVPEPGTPCPACGEETWEFYGDAGVCVYCYKGQ